MSTFIPKFLARNETQSTRQVITSDYWNEMFNLLITQGDYNSQTLNAVINDAAWNLGAFIKDSSGVNLGRQKYLQFNSTNVVVDGDTIKIEGLTGPVGPQGERGLATPGISILGMYATIEDLLLAHPVGSEGDAWAVGDTESNVLYVWDYVAEEWVNIGSVQGLQGPQGAVGEGVPAGGDVGQFLSKVSGTDYDTTWASLPSEVQYLTGVTSSIQTQLNAKQATINLAGGRAVVSTTEGGLVAATATTSEINYLSGVTSSLQTQLNGKLGSTATAVNSTKWSGRQCFVSSTTPSGAVNGDIWFQI